MTQGEIEELLLRLANEVATEEKIPLKIERFAPSASASVSNPEKLMLGPFRIDNGVLKGHLWHSNGPSDSNRRSWDVEISISPLPLSEEAFKKQVRSVLKGMKFSQ